MNLQQKQKEFDRHMEEIDGNYKATFNKIAGLAGEKY